MSVAPCPRCRDDISVPGGVPPEAIAQCPLCGEEFELSEVLHSLPPALIIIKSPQTTGAATSAAQGSGFDFAAADDSADDEFRLAADTDEQGDASPGFAFDAHSSDSASAGGASSGSVTARPRKKKKASNPALEVLKVAGGGVGGIMLALVLLWYLPFGKATDFLGIGPTVYKIPVVGQIVPAKFRGTPATEDDTSSAEPAVDDLDIQLGTSSEVATPPDSLSGVGTLNQQTPTDSNNEDPLAANEPSLDAGPEDPFAINPGELPAVDFPEIDPVANDPPGPRAPGGQLLGPIDRPQVSAAELQASVDALNQSVVTYAESIDLEGQERLTVATNHYKDYGKLAQAITFVDQTDPSISGEVQLAEQMLRDLGNDPEKTAIMQFFAADQLGKPATYGKGIVLIGTVTDAKAMGRIFATKVMIQPKKGEAQEVTIVSPASPADVASGFMVGSKVAVLGTISTDPAENMRGYQGNEPVAVWGGYFLVLQPND